MWMVFIVLSISFVVRKLTEISDLLLEFLLHLFEIKPKHLLPKDNFRKHENFERSYSHGVPWNASIIQCLQWINHRTDVISVSMDRMWNVCVFVLHFLYVKKKQSNRKAETRLNRLELYTVKYVLFLVLIWKEQKWNERKRCAHSIWYEQMPIG